MTLSLLLRTSMPDEGISPVAVGKEHPRRSSTPVSLVVVHLPPVEQAGIAVGALWADLRASMPWIESVVRPLNRGVCRHRSLISCRDAPMRTCVTAISCVRRWHDPPYQRSESVKGGDIKISSSVWLRTRCCAPGRRGNHNLFPMHHAKREHNVAARPTGLGSGVQWLLLMQQRVFPRQQGNAESMLGPFQTQDCDYEWREGASAT